MGKEDIPAVSLVFDPRVRVGGETLEGAVDLYFPSLMEDNVEEVHIKLRGSIVTRITRRQGNQTFTHRSRVDLCHETISLWQKGCNLYPPAGTHILQLPFRFILPASLPPSCHFSGFEWEGTVGYALEAVGERPGLHFNRRVLISFPVLPYDLEGAGLRSAFGLEGWSGRWKTIQQKDEIRRGIWGDYSNVMATLVLPDIEAFPVMTPIPFTLNVVTVSKTMKKDETDDDDTIFPPPPLLKKNLEFSLERVVHVQALNWNRTSSHQFVTFLGGMANDKSDVFYKDVQVIPTEKVWIPSQDAHDEKKHKGQWKQEVTFKSFISLSCPPTFSSQIMSVQYNARLKVEFPGIGNDLKFELPLRIISCMPPPGTQTWDGPPPQLDLPPAYFAAEGWHNEAEKE